MEGSTSDRIDSKEWIKQLASEDSVLRMQAVGLLSLSKNRSKEVLLALTNALKDRSYGVREIAEWGLKLESGYQETGIGGLNEPHTQHELGAGLSPLRSVHGAPADVDHIMPAVFAGLRSINESDRTQSIRLIRLLGKDAMALLPTLQLFLFDSSFLVRLAVVMVIGNKTVGFAKDVIRNSLLRVIEDPHDLVRMAARELIERET